MKIISYTIIPFLMFCVLGSCQMNSIHELIDESLTYVDITQAKFGNGNAEEIFTDFEIIPLELSPKSRLKIESARYYLTDKYIIGVNSFGPAYLFDRKTGAFIREVSSMGRGSDEYTGMLHSKYGFDEDNNILFASDGYAGKFWKGINIETNKIETFVRGQ